MKDNQTERAVETNGAPDLSLMPKDLFDLLVADIVSGTGQTTDSAEQQ